MKYYQRRNVFILTDPFGDFSSGTSSSSTGAVLFNGTNVADLANDMQRMVIRTILRDNQLAPLGLYNATGCNEAFIAYHKTTVEGRAVLGALTLVSWTLDKELLKIQFRWLSGTPLALGATPSAPTYCHWRDPITCAAARLEAHLHLLAFPTLLLTLAAPAAAAVLHDRPHPANTLPLLVPRLHYTGSAMRHGDRHR
jgi:hypothetical protein